MKKTKDIKESTFWKFYIMGLGLFLMMVYIVLPRL